MGIMEIMAEILQVFLARENQVKAWVGVYS